MIEFRDGDLLEQTDLDAIIHQCNCFGVMGAGIAKQIAKKYPCAVEADKRYLPGDRKKLGSYTCGVDKVTNLHIINLYGQFHYGIEKRQTDYDAVKRALLEVKEDYCSHYLFCQTPMKIGIPYNMGCGLAGGSWNVIEAMLKELFETAEEYILVLVKKE